VTLGQTVTYDIPCLERARNLKIEDENDDDVPEGRCDRSLARSAWESPTPKDPSCRARCDSGRCTHESIENVFGLPWAAWAASLSRMEPSITALAASQTISISVSRSFRKRSIPLSSSSNNIGPFEKISWPPKEARGTFRREISMGLAAPDHTVP
jgi:hypothetical protein